ncbi:hypothetical protein Poli38472_010910 [Pythium oligandrum]|uniref:Tc1-like transposase DDE domain-containing protein n=1 Tax=Pythium oligandrum TaxID=41045 RepID=A0A8K1FJI6_PYTOL|nr:hypothetical protein Poli38472_010910 [Pythium oligandrum]|eukprot:TMW61847.1 hypothetical protein Poli38472_010910 [Pythium oligandrum]
MNADVFYDWLEKKVFPAIPSGSVVVIDRASYHTTLTEETKPAKSTFRKDEFAQWLVNHGVVTNGRRTKEAYMELTRVELASICKENKPTPAYQVSALAKKFGCEMLLLPVGHPELNPIEMVWAYVKGYVAKRNVTFSLTDVERLANEALDKFDATEWTKYVQHCIRVEDKFLAAADTVPIELDA